MVPCPLCCLRCMDKTLQSHDRGSGPAPYYHHAPFGPRGAVVSTQNGLVSQPVASLDYGVVKQHQIGPCPLAPAAAMLRVRLTVVVGRREHRVTDCCHALVCRWPQHALSSNLWYILCEMTNQAFAAWPFFCLSTYHLDGKKGKDTYSSTGRWMEPF